MKRPSSSGVGRFIFAAVADFIDDSPMNWDTRRAFTLVELLVVLAIIAVLLGALLGAWPSIMAGADRADAMAKIRQAGTSVIQYTADHAGRLPPLFPGQVLEFRSDRRGRIVTECASYLEIDPNAGTHLVRSLLPRAYARLTQPPNPLEMRVFVMNSAITNASGVVLRPFGGISGGEVDGRSAPLAAILAGDRLVMMSTADQQQPWVAAAPWRNQTPANPPLGKGRRAVFYFDGGAEMVESLAP
jgi:prepilin-type N-terminal cleavage/methylation domain-containing protein